MAASARVHVVTGKGGVGKTTVSLALGRWLAAHGARTLVLDLAPGLGLSAMLDTEVTHVPVALTAGLDVAATNGARAIDEATVAFSPSRRLALRLLRVESLRAFLGAAPGVPEVALLHRIDAFRTSGRYDAMVVDADASGHLRLLLDAPDVLRRIGAAGPVRRALDAASGMLADADRTRFHIVTLPTALALEETRELVAMLAERRAPLGTLFVSRAPPRLGLDGGVVASLAARARGAPPAEDLVYLEGTLDERARLDRFLTIEARRFRRIVERPLDASTPLSVDPLGEDDA